ncbi:ankyrin repeat domain-containing protein [Acetobacter oeni]|nr:ankyrin repeat domain-containing protein [Acetobacter oeni]
MKRRLGLHLSLAISLAGVAGEGVPLRHAHAQAEDAEQAEAEADAAEAAKKAEDRRAAKQAAPPAALPGAETNEEGGHSNMDIEPTAALFEAINRGSLGGAREAVNRGADLSGHNVLGQTPLDMSIDLNRNDITFFLLSMRSLEGSGDETTTAVASSGIDMAGGSGHMRVGGKASRAEKVIDSRYDASGGRPQPSVGFLGFGGS